MANVYPTPPPWPVQHTHQEMEYTPDLGLWNAKVGQRAVGTQGHCIGTPLQFCTSVTDCHFPPPMPMLNIQHVLGSVYYAPCGLQASSQMHYYLKFLLVETSKFSTVI